MLTNEQNAVRKDWLLTEKKHTEYILFETDVIVSVKFYLIQCRFIDITAECLEGAQFFSGHTVHYTTVKQYLCFSFNIKKKLMTVIGLVQSHYHEGNTKKAKEVCLR